MKTTIKVTGIEKAQTQKGKTFWKLETSEGLMSCWDADLIEGIEENLNQNINAEIQESADKKFKSIRSFDTVEMGYPGDGETPTTTETTWKSTTGEKFTNDKFSNARASKDTSMYTSYAKDMFIASLYNRPDMKEPLDSKFVMDQCIALVKQARDAF